MPTLCIAATSISRFLRISGETSQRVGATPDNPSYAPVIRFHRVKEQAIRLGKHYHVNGGFALGHFNHLSDPQVGKSRVKRPTKFD